MLDNYIIQFTDYLFSYNSLRISGIIFLSWNVSLSNANEYLRELTTKVISKVFC